MTYRKSILLLFVLLFSISSYANNWNISTDIFIGARAGMWYRGEHKINDQYSLGIGYLRFAKEYYSDYEMQQYLIYGTYWFNSTFKKGWLINLELSNSIISYEIDDDNTENLSGLGYGFAGGYQWFWGSFNTGILLHLRAYTFDTWIKFDEEYSSGQSFVPHHHHAWLSWSVGWAF